MNIFTRAYNYLAGIEHDFVADITSDFNKVSAKLHSHAVKSFTKADALEDKADALNDQAKTAISSAVQAMRVAENIEAITNAPTTGPVASTPATAAQVSSIAASAQAVSPPTSPVN